MQQDGRKNGQKKFKSKNTNFRYCGPSVVGGGGGEVGGVSQLALEPAHTARGDKPKQPGIINLDYTYLLALVQFYI